MLFHAVVKMTNMEEMHERILHNINRTERFAIYSASQKEARADDAISVDEQIHWCVDARSANAVAESLAKTFPGVSFASIQINNVYSAVVQEVVSRKFDPQKGLLPS